MHNISLMVSGFDYIPEERNYQFYIMAFKNWDTEHCRCLFSCGITEGEITIDLFFIHVKRTY